MQSKFTADFFRGNRRALASKLDGELAVLTANAVLQQSNDVPFPFFQDRFFWYLTGLDEPEAVLVLDLKAGKEFLILAKRDDRRDLWDGTRDAAKLAETSGIQTIYHAAEGWAALKPLLAAASRVHTITPAKPYHKFYEFYVNPARAVLAARLKRRNPKIELVDARNELISLRIIKQKPELAAIERAVDITLKTLGNVEKKLGSFTNEAEIDGLLSGEYRRLADGHSFEPIVAAGKNAATVHYRDNKAAYRPQDMLLIDTGVTVDHYASDISRTFAARAGNTKRQQAVYDAVVRMQEYAMSLIKPGVKHREYETMVQTRMGDELVALGLLEENTPQNVRRLYPQMTSHHLGLDLHDVAQYDEAFAPGMVLTVEPGIYIPVEGIGVRIEDDVVITDSGIRVLSALQ